MSLTVNCIKTFIKHHDNDLYEAVNDLCLGELKPARGADGITFLMPTKEFRDTFIKTAHSDPDAASSMLNACIIDDIYPTLADLHKAGKVVNRLNQEMDVKVAGTTGTLNNGSTITKCDKFKPSSMRSNIMVYNLEGPIPTNGKVVERTPIAKKMSKKTGGAELSRSRYVLAKRVENDYCLFREGKGGLKCCPYTTELGNLLAYLKHCCDDKKAYEDVVKVLDYNVVASFYIIFEPYHTGNGPKVLSDEHFNEYVKKGFCPSPAKMIISCIDELGASVDKGVMKQVQEVVDQAMIPGPGKLIAKVYGNDKKRQAQDEFRDFVDMSLEDLESWNYLNFVDFIKDVSRLSSNFSDVKYTVDQLRYIIKPGTEYYSGSYRFIRTTYFNYVPLSATQMESMRSAGSPEYGEFNDTSLILRNLHHYEKLKASFSDCNDEMESLKAKLECFSKCA